MPEMVREAEADRRRQQHRGDRGQVRTRRLTHTHNVGAGSRTCTCDLHQGPDARRAVGPAGALLLSYPRVERHGRAILRSWVGENPSQEDMKKALLGG